MKISQKVYDLCLMLEDKKAENIVVCNTEKLANPVDFYIVVTATSPAHAKGILDYLEEQISLKNMFLYVARDGLNASKWDVLDVGEGFIHVLTKELRERYNLEKLVNEGSNVKPFEKLKKDFEKEAKNADKTAKKVVLKKENKSVKREDKKRK